MISFNPNSILPCIKSVDSNVIRGRATHSCDEIRALKEQGVTQILDFRTMLSPSQYLEKLRCMLLGVKHINMGFRLTSKNVPEKAFFDEMVENIQNNKGKTYVHCKFGLHRTGFGVAMYEKGVGKDSETVVKDLITNGYSKSSTDTFNDKKINKQHNTLMTFLNRFFPEQVENAQKLLDSGV